jgi:hypothetical protein
LPDWFYSQKGTPSGPYTEERLRGLAQAGVIRPDTLCWCDHFGSEWRPFAKTGLYVPQPVAAPAVNGINAYAWMCAAIPWVGMPIDVLLGLYAPASSNAGNALNLVYSVAYIVLVSRDWKVIGAAGLVTRGKQPSRWWCLLIPVYLWKRARYLQQSKACFWTWMAGLLVMIGVEAGLAAVQQTSLTSCQSQAGASDVINLVNTLQYMKTLNVKVISLSQQRETAATPTLRSCSGSLLGSDGKSYPLNYSFEKRADGVYVHVTLLQ